MGTITIASYEIRKIENVITSRSTGKLGNEFYSDVEVLRVQRSPLKKMSGGAIQFIRRVLGYCRFYRVVSWRDCFLMGLLVEPSLFHWSGKHFLRLSLFSLTSFIIFKLQPFSFSLHPHIYLKNKISLLIFFTTSDNWLCVVWCKCKSTLDRVLYSSQSITTIMRSAICIVQQRKRGTSWSCHQYFIEAKVIFVIIVEDILPMLD